jgi:hypothetical protein
MTFRGRTRLTLISARRDSDLLIGIQLAPPVRGIRFRQGLEQAWAAARRRILVAVDAIEGLLGGVEDEVRRVVTEEALAHVDDGLLGRCGGCLVDDGPATVSVFLRVFNFSTFNLSTHERDKHSPYILALTRHAGSWLQFLAHVDG